MNKDNFQTTATQLPQTVLNEIGRINGILFNNFVKHQDEIKQLNQELQSVSKEKAEIEKKYLSLSNGNTTNTTTTTTTADNDNKEDEQIKDKKEFNNEEYENKISKLTESLKEIQENRDRLVRDQEGERERYELQVKSLQIEITSLLTQVSEQQQGLKLLQVYEFKENKLVEERDDLLNKLQEQRDQYDQVKLKLDEQIKYMNDFKLQVEHKEQNYIDPTQLINDNKQLEEKFEVLDRVKGELHSEVERLTEEIQRIKQESSSNINQLQKEVNTLKEAKSELNQNVESQLQLVSGLNQQIQDLSNKETTGTTEQLELIQSLNKKIKELKESEEKKNIENQELQAKLEKLHESHSISIGGQSETIERLNQDIQSKDQILKEQNEQLISKIAEFEKIKSTNEKYLILLEEFDKQKYNLDEQVKLKIELQDSIKNERAINQSLITQLEEKDNEIKNQLSEIKNLNSQQLKTNDIIIKLENQIQHYQETYHVHDEIEVTTNLTDTIIEHHSSDNENIFNNNQENNHDINENNIVVENNNNINNSDEPQQQQQSEEIRTRVEDIVEELYRTGTPPLQASIPRVHQDLIDIDLNSGSILSTSETQQEDEDEESY